MKRNFRIAMILTVLLLVLWILAAIIYSVTTGMKPNDSLPDFLLYPVLSIIAAWVIVGLYLIVRYYRIIKEELIEFINEK